MPPPLIETSPIPTSHADIGHSTLEHNDGDDFSLGSVDGPDDFTENLVEYVDGRRELESAIHRMGRHQPKPNPLRRRESATEENDLTDEIVEYMNGMRGTPRQKTWGGEGREKVERVAPDDADSTREDGPTEFTRFIDSYVGKPLAAKAAEEEKAAAAAAKKAADTAAAQNTTNPERKHSLQPTVSDESENRQHEISHFIDGIFGGPLLERDYTAPLPTSADDTVPLPQPPEHVTNGRTNGKTGQAQAHAQIQSQPRVKTPSPVHLESDSMLAQMEAMQKQLAEMQERLAERDTQIAQRDNEIKSLRIQLTQRTTAMNELEEWCADNDEAQVQDLKRKITQKDSTITHLQQTLEGHNKEIDGLRHDVSVRDDAIKALQDLNQKRLAKHNSVIKAKDEKFKAALDMISNRHRLAIEAQQAVHKKETNLLRQELSNTQSVTEIEAQRVEYEKETKSLRQQLSHIQSTWSHQTEKLNTQAQKLVAQKSTIKSLQSRIQTMESASKELDIQISQRIAKREEHWEKKMKELQKEKEKMGRVLMREWGRQECGQGEGGIQPYRYKFVSR
ncbi:putative spindle pole body associated protein [Phaeomoniella chlamydospora]|uniref:Putative spindle pole body associated protein n=1 Tax=Phaeomoniella chlamydospora TaxID=158046 RepID=A0A0G2DYD3_PHACM|nr:putative spindle pole body associated protein [Phaeomoniella chlamydospora]